jgi:hypothetical protein
MALANYHAGETPVIDGATIMLRGLDDILKIRKRPDFPSAEVLSE